MKRIIILLLLPLLLAQILAWGLGATGNQQDQAPAVLPYDPLR
jgi:hypothetical protein